MSEAIRVTPDWARLKPRLARCLRPELRGSWRWFAHTFGPAALLLSVAVALRLLGVTGKGGTIAVVIGGLVVFVAERAGRELVRWRGANAGDGLPDAILLDETGISGESETARSWRAWSSLTAITAEDWGLALWFGPSVLPLPDAALPDGLDRAALRARIETWRAGPE